MNSGLDFGQLQTNGKRRYELLFSTFGEKNYVNFGPLTENYRVL